MASAALSRWRAPAQHALEQARVDHDAVACHRAHAHRDRPPVGKDDRPAGRVDGGVELVGHQGVVSGLVHASHAPLAGEVSERDRRRGRRGLGGSGSLGLVLGAAGLSDLPADLIDVDILIGEPDLIGHGIGPQALALLLDRLRAEGLSFVGMATAAANQRALRAYEKAGFHLFRAFQEDGQEMCYLVRSLDAAV